jgi:hypothetical protein
MSASYFRYLRPTWNKKGGAIVRIRDAIREDGGLIVVRERNFAGALRVPIVLRGEDLKVTPEIVERIKRLRRLGRRVADIAQLCGLSEPTVRKVLESATTKESTTEPRKAGMKIDWED